MPERSNRSRPHGRPIADRESVFPLRAAAALFLERQHLVKPRSKRLTSATLTRFAEDVGGIQLDSINVLDRAHYLTVWSRFGPYDRAALDRLVEKKRVLFEYWAHAACLVPASHLPAWRRAMIDYRSRQTGWSSWLKKNRKMIEGVESAIRERGPLGNSDFQGARPKGSNPGWWSWKPSTHAFHHLWMNGRLLVHSRKHFHKRFDLAERVLPQFEACEPLDADGFMRWHIRRSLHAMGAATETDLSRYLTFPRYVTPHRKRSLAAMIAGGEVREIRIEGSRVRWLTLAADLDALVCAGRRRVASRGTTLLAPFDSFLWHRERTSRLFGFDYRIEVYTPGHQRVHGYYTLPLLHDSQLIGRVDAKQHRSERRLEVRNVHFEPWFANQLPPPAATWGRVDRDAGLAGLAGALRSLAEFFEAERIDVGRTDPAGLASALRSLLRDAAATTRSERFSPRIDMERAHGS